MKMYEGAEPYRRFMFGDQLHLHDDDTKDEEGPAFWLGVVPYGAAFEPSAYTDSAELIAVVLEWRCGQALPAWMPLDAPYWHRASHCPRKEL